MRVSAIGATLLALAIVATLGPQRASASAPASTCPEIWNFVRVGQQNLYALTLRANKPMTTDVTIKLRAGIAPFIATLPAVAIDRSTKAALVPYRSNVIVLPEPTDEKVTDVVVDFRGTSVDCPSEARTTAPAHAVYPPSDASNPTGAYDDLRKSLDAEALNAMPIAMQSDPDPPSLCTGRDAKATHLFPPQYPDIAKQTGGVEGTVGIIIDLDNAGHISRADVFHSSGNASLDEAGLQSALQSTFQSASIDCIDTAGVYLFRADFRRST